MISETIKSVKKKERKTIRYNQFKDKSSIYRSKYNRDPIRGSLGIPYPFNFFKIFLIPLLVWSRIPITMMLVTSRYR